MLFDDKGTYEYTDQPKDLILSSLVRRLKSLVNECLGGESTMQALAHTLMALHTGTPQDLQRKYLRLARSVLQIGRVLRFGWRISAKDWD